jgi:hypothetical protein
LVREKPENEEKAGKHFVVDNPDLQEHLYLAGIMHSLPSVLDQNDPEAEMLYKEMDWEHWHSAATWGR